MVSCNKHLKQGGGCLVCLLVLTMDTTLKVEIEDLKSRPMSRIVGDPRHGYTKLSSERSYDPCGEREQRKMENKSPKERPKVSMSNSGRNINIKKHIFFNSNLKSAPEIDISYLAPSVQSVWLVFLWSGQSADSICSISAPLPSLRDSQQRPSEVQPTPDDTQAKTGRHEASCRIRIDGISVLSFSLVFATTEALRPCSVTRT